MEVACSPTYNRSKTEPGCIDSIATDVARLCFIMRAGAHAIFKTHKWPMRLCIAIAVIIYGKYTYTGLLEGWSLPESAKVSRRESEPNHKPGFYFASKIPFQNLHTPNVYRRGAPASTGRLVFVWPIRLVSFGLVGPVGVESRPPGQHISPFGRPGRSF